MATYTNVNKNMNTLKTVLENSGYFTSVQVGTETVGSYTYDTVSCYIGEHVFLKFGKNGSGSSTRNLFAVYFNNTTCKPTNDSYSNVYMPTAAYQCSGGLVLLTDSNRIVIAPNQEGVPAVIFGSANATSTSTETVMAQIGAIAATDTGIFTLYTINQAIFTQTILAPVCTCTGFDAASYTPTVKLAVYKQHTAIGHIIYNNKQYFFDGYFATEDKEDDAT